MYCIYYFRFEHIRNTDGTSRKIGWEKHLQNDVISCRIMGVKRELSELNNRLIDLA